VNNETPCVPVGARESKIKTAANKQDGRAGFKKLD
jgi:hypothetical protein